MPKPKPALSDILNAIQTGERLGIDEALIFLAETKKVIDRSGSEKFFDLASQAAQKRHSARALSIERFDLEKFSLEQIEARAAESNADIFHLRFAPKRALVEIIAAIERVSKQVGVAAFSPNEILDCASRENAKVSRVCQLLGVSGLSFASGRFASKGSDAAAIDEAFSVMMQLSKAKVMVSATLPMSFSEEEKAVHLAKLREFQDRTQAIAFVTLHLDSTFSDRALLRTIALMRLMLDNIETISLCDYDLRQEKKIDGDLLRQCIDIGLNQI
jgi:2-iminoacetate synthase ThiH